MSKHNKKRNSYFLYEALVRELTNSIINEDAERKDKILKLLKKHFHKKSLLRKEVELYKTLNETSGLEEKVAEKFLTEVKRAYATFGQQEIFDAQSELINDVNKEIGKCVYSAFVPNFRSLATIYQIFNGSSLTPKKKIMLEQNMLKSLTLNHEIKENEGLQPVNKLAFNLFVKKFNEEYGSGLLKEQYELLQKYVTSVENDVEFRVYLNEELSRLKGIVQKSLNEKEIKNDKEMIEKTKKVLTIMESFKEKPIDGEILEQTLRIQQLTKEILD